MKYFLLLFSFYSLSLYAEEDLLYSISSLYEHIQELKNNKTSEQFEDEDIDQLWQDADCHEYRSLLEQAKYYYDHSHYEEAENHLAYLLGHQLAYPNFDKNPFIQRDMKNEMAPYLLPKTHTMKPILDNIFSTSRVTSSIDTLKAAGFKILYVKEASYIIVASHPQVPGYLFKIYPDTEVRTRLNKPSWKWLLNRCKGAKIIKKIIKKNNIKNFTVPDKWLYPLPPFPAQGVQHPVILLVKDMKLVSGDATKAAWQTVVTKKHLDELYIILSQGSGSNFLSGNVPFTKDGTFTFIDTEYPHRNINLTKVKLYIAPELHPYWDQLIGQ